MHDPNLHLFVDDREIQQLINVQRVVNEVRKWPEPVLIADQPWEPDVGLSAWGSVIREKDGTFRIWYMLPGRLGEGSAYCYAESSDGIHWVKPNLGLFEWKGSKANNVIYLFDQN